MKVNRKPGFVKHRPAKKGDLPQKIQVPVFNEYAVIVQAAMDGFWIIDFNGKILDCNRTLCQMLGYSREELLRLRIGDVDVSETPERIKEHIQKVFQTGGDRFQTVHRRKDGTRIDVEISTQYEASLGKRLFVFIRDITEQKRIEAALALETELNEAILNSVPGMLYLYDIDGKLVRWNKQHEQMTGYSPEELSHMQLMDWYQGDEKSQKAVLAGVNETIHAGFGDAEAELQTKDGRIIPMYFTASPLVIQGKQYFAGLGFDISERKRVERALRESEARFRSLVENASDIVYSLTPEGVFSYVSPNWKELLGHEVSEVQGQPYDRFVHPDDLPRTRAYLEKSLAAGGKQGGIEYRVMHKDGSWRWHMTTASVIKNAEGQPVTFIGTAHDVTEKKEAENQVRKLNDELERRVSERTAQLQAANQELESFSYSVSHDLRSPLRIIDGWSQILLEDYQDCLDEQGQKYLQRVRAETQHMGRLIDDLLQFSRLTRIELRNERVDMSELAQKIIFRLEEVEPLRRVNFVIQSGLFAQGDGRLLEIVLSNLLNNAFKFTQKEPQAQIEFGQIEQDGVRVFFVRDNGVGFDMAYQDKLFGPFQRLHQATEFPGTGIGLATVRRIIQRHGGQVWAESQVNQGATFYFTLGAKLTAP